LYDDVGLSVDPMHSVYRSSLVGNKQTMGGWMVRVYGILSTQIAAVSCLK